MGWRVYVGVSVFLYLFMMQHDVVGDALQLIMIFLLLLLLLLLDLLALLVSFLRTFIYTLDEFFRVPTNCLRLEIPNCRSCICRHFSHFDGVSCVYVSNILIGTPFDTACTCMEFCVECIFFDSTVYHYGAFEFFQEQYCRLNYFVVHSIVHRIPLNHQSTEFAVSTLCTASFVQSTK